MIIINIKKLRKKAKITQEERLDLKNLKEEWNAYYNNLLDRIKTMENKKVVMEKDVKDSDLMAENKRLKEQLDKEIHINRKMKRALEKYADLKNWRCDTITGFQSVWQGVIDDEQTGNITAQQILKEIDNKE